MKKLTRLKQAKQILATHGITIAWKPLTEEFRVNFKGGREATAYYTNDLDDAAHTGVYMAQTRGTPKAYSGRIIFDGYLGKFQNVADDGTVLNQANTAEQAEAFGEQTK